MYKRGIKINPLSIPWRHRCVALHILNTTELYLGTYKTRYMQWIRDAIFGPSLH